MVDVQPVLAVDDRRVNPKRISFRKGGIITSVLALVSMPWNLYNNPDVIARGAAARRLTTSAQELGDCRLT